MADWLADVKKYDPNADEAIVAAMVKTYNLVLQKKDASLVAFSDPEEVERVKTNFCKKKLGLTDEAAMDAALAEIKEQMKADRTKNRLTVYYLLAKKFGKLGVFAK